MTPTRATPSGRQFLWRELRSNALAIGLVFCTVVVVITAAVMANNTARRYRVFTSRALREFAAMGAWSFSMRAFSELEDVAATYSRLQGARAPSAGPDVAKIMRGADSLAHCRCGAHVSAHGFATGVWGDSSSVIYRAVPETPSAKPAAPTDAQPIPSTDRNNGASADAAIAARLSAIKLYAATTPSAQWPVTVRAGQDASLPFLLLFVPLRLPPQYRASFLVVDVDLSDWSNRMLNNLHAERSTILSSALVNGIRNRDIARFRVYSRGAGTYFERETNRPSGIEASVPLDRDTSVLVSIDLSQSVAERIVQGALPGSSAALEIALPFFAVLLVFVIGITVLRAERLSRARSHFAASVSHELRTPLAHILLNAETLHFGRERDALDRESIAGVIAREARRLVYLVENVLQFSKSEHDLLQLQSRSVRLDRIVSELADNWASLIDAAGATLEVDADEAVCAGANPAAVQLVLTNLLDNALRHAPRTAIRLHVSGSTPHAVVIIDDSGPGIPANQMHRMFEPFQRAPQANARHPTGAGIGLAVVAQLMQAMNGTIHMGTSPTGGLRVELRLPRVRTMDPASSNDVGDPPTVAGKIANSGEPAQ